MTRIHSSILAHGNRMNRRLVLSVPLPAMESAGLGADGIAARLEQSVKVRGRVYRRRLQRCQKGFSTDSVHDLRIALRRLIAALTVLNAIVPVTRLNQAKQWLKKQLKDLSQLRDAQIQLQYVRGLEADHRELRPFLAHLTQQESSLVREAEKRVCRIKPARTMKRIKAGRRRFRRDFVAGADSANPARPLRELVVSAYAGVRRCRCMVEADAPKTLHRLRVALKKFRYMSEALQPVLPEITAAQLKSMQRFQMSLGWIQDLRVLLDNLRAFVRRGSRRDAALLRPIRQLLRRRLRSRVNGLLNSADRTIAAWAPPSVSTLVNPARGG
ncbi:MAG: CHAD domain-containing protein [Candidatus Omnitrophica bacterium]|nr:CHAD domain-containing protein [Candidatus Omnitrophota bacterium]